MEEQFNIKQMIIFVVVILLVLGIFYGITLLVTKNKNSDSNSNTEISNDDAVIDYDTILVQNIFKQTSDSYYVFAYTEDDDNTSTYNNDIVSYKNKENALKVYYIELSSAFNKTYVASESNFVSEYPIFKETTLLKIENGKITEIYEGKDQITNALTILKGE